MRDPKRMIFKAIGVADSIAPEWSERIDQYLTIQRCFHDSDPLADLVKYVGCTHSVLNFHVDNRWKVPFAQRSYGRNEQVCRRHYVARWPQKIVGATENAGSFHSRKILRELGIGVVSGFLVIYCPCEPKRYARVLRLLPIDGLKFRDVDASRHVCNCYHFHILR